MNQISSADGTTNFAHGYPSFAVSVGVLFRGRPVAAAVVNKFFVDLAADEFSLISF